MTAGSVDPKESPVGFTLFHDQEDCKSKCVHFADEAKSAKEVRHCIGSTFGEARKGVDA